MQFIVCAMLAFLWWLPAQAADQTRASFTVHLRAQNTVMNTSVVLADIADLSGDDEDELARLAKTPLGSVAEERLLTRAEVLSQIRSCFPEPNEVQITGAEFARVSIATRPAQAAELAAVLKAHLAACSGWSESEIEIRSIENLATLELPQGDIQLKAIADAEPANYRSALIPVSVDLDGRPWRTLWIKADVRVRAGVVQVTKRIPYGAVLQAGDLRELVSDLDDPRVDYVRTCEEAVGMTAKRALTAGLLLNRNWLNESNLVRSGEIVRLVALSSGVRITARAHALQNGKLGDRIKVRNVDSDRMLTAVVTGRGEVSIRN